MVLASVSVPFFPKSVPVLRAHPPQPGYPHHPMRRSVPAMSLQASRSIMAWSPVRDTHTGRTGADPVVVGRETGPPIARPAGQVPSR
jgi:hypothetical protein